MKEKKKQLILIVFTILVINILAQAFLSVYLIKSKFNLLVITDDKSDEAKVFLHGTSLHKPLQADMIDDEPVWVAYWVGEKTFFADNLKAVKSNVTQEMTDVDHYFSFLKDGGVAYINPQGPVDPKLQSYTQFLYGKNILPALRDLQNGGRLQRICGKWCLIDRVTLFVVSNNGYFAYLETKQGEFVRFYAYDKQANSTVTVEMPAEEYEKIRGAYWELLSEKSADGEKELGATTSLWDYLQLVDYEVRSPARAGQNPLYLFVRLATSVVLTTATTTVGVIVIKKRVRKKSAPVEV